MDLKVDVFVDIKDRNYVWIMITSKDKKLSRKKEEIMRFDSYQVYSNYAHQFLKGAKFCHHSIDYGSVEYYYHSYNPQLDYIALKYYEYIDGTRQPKKITFSPSFKKDFLEILRVNKKIPYFMPIDSRYYKDIDVVAEGKRKHQETIQTIKMSLNEFFSLAGETIKTIKSNPYIVKGLKIFAIAAISAGLLQGGYTLVNNHEIKSEFLIQKSPLQNIEEASLYIQKSRIGPILEQLLQGNYIGITKEDIKELIEFFKTIEDNNYDNNDSFNLINYEDYIKYKTNFTGNNLGHSITVLENIDELYKKCFVQKGNKMVFKKDGADEYIKYMLSLVFMYDTYYSSGRPYNRLESTELYSHSFATYGNIEAFDHYPPALKFIILNQLKGVVKRADFELKETDRTAYYFGSLDKNTILDKIDELLKLVTKNLYDAVSVQTENKTI